VDRTRRPILPRERVHATGAAGCASAAARGVGGGCQPTKSICRCCRKRGAMGVRGRCGQCAEPSSHPLLMCRSEEQNALACRGCCRVNISGPTALSAPMPFRIREPALRGDESPTTVRYVSTGRSRDHPLADGRTSTRVSARTGGSRGICVLLIHGVCQAESTSPQRRCLPAVPTTSACLRPGPHRGRPLICAEGRLHIAFSAAGCGQLDHRRGRPSGAQAR